MDYEELAQLEEKILDDVDQETVLDLEAELTHLIAHSAVTAIHQSEKMLNPNGEGLDYDQMSKLEDIVVNDIDKETLSSLAKDLTHLIAHSMVTAIHQSEKMLNE